MDDEYMTLNIDKCIADRSRPAVIRSLFVDIRDRCYVTPGEFFGGISDMDLEVLRVYSEQIARLDGHAPSTDEHHTAYENLGLLSMGLLVGDGLEITEDTSVHALKTTVLLISLEHLARLGMIDVYRDNWSMDPTDVRPIAKGKK